MPRTPTPMFTLDGITYDMPDAVRGWHAYSSQDRANHQANFRMTRGQREAVGEAFWTHERCPGVCFPTRIQARRAAVASLAAPTAPDQRTDA